MPGIELTRLQQERQYWERQRLLDPTDRENLHRAAQAQIIRDQEALEERARVANNQADMNARTYVWCLLVLFVLLLWILLNNGMGLPDFGEEFRQSSEKLRHDATDRLQQACPREWSGAVGGAAHNYSYRVSRQRSHLHAIMEADQQIANALEVQAGQVTLGRQGVEAAIAALLGGIAVAEVMEAQWKAAIGTPAAPALEVALVTFVMGLAAVTAAKVLGVLVFLITAGQRNQHYFHQARDKYQQVADGVVAPTAVAFAAGHP